SPASAGTSSRMMSLQSSMHSSQMKTDGPAISFLTSCWLLPQNEQYRTFSLEEPFLSAIDLGIRRQEKCWNDDSSKEIGAFASRKAPIPSLLLGRRSARRAQV